MTRTTLKALWFGGGGILATWLAVSPEQAVPTAAPASAVQQQAVVTQPTAEQLNAQAGRLRDRTADVTLRPSTRNPFRYSSKKPVEATLAPRDPDAQSAALEPLMPATPPPPALRLSGVARTGGKRTAIITIDGQIYLVGDGDSFAGRYTAVKVDPETVLVRDGDGVEQRLTLP